ncbi:MAG TPA: DUF2071 domain-containing protein [Gemmataceae bacterium]|nr:DUF2071 domain-containing protein [Gemmataceae bacterium]
MLVEQARAPLLSENVATPPGPWHWAQTWRDVFFAHWQVPAQALKPHLPAGLEVDAWQGGGWISAVAFYLDVQHRRLPSFGLTSGFVELNLRTYVRWRDQPGIYFLSIHAGSRIAVGLARLLTPLPYVYAPLSYRRNGNQWRLRCQQSNVSLLDAEFSTANDAATCAADSLDTWLVERYRLFAPARHGQVQRLIVRHPPWEMRAVSGQVSAEHLGKPWGADLSRQPDEMHFANQIPARLWPFEAIH